MWYGVDYDKTLVDENGQPIHHMVSKVKKALHEGKDVRIFTARVSSGDTQEVDDFCKYHFDRNLPITNVKDPEMEELWDDKTVNPETSMLQGIGQLQGVMKETTPMKKKKKNKFMEALSKFSKKSKKYAY